MELLIKGITIINHLSPFHGKRIDLYIKDGLVHSLGESIEVAGIEAIYEPNIYCSIGWFDLTAHLGEPGFEHRETKESFIRAASYGGFTEVATLPNLSPITQSKSSVQNIRSGNPFQTVILHPIGAVTENCEGKDLAEILDMDKAGAVAFSDGLNPIQDSSTILKALEYISLMDGLLMNRPENQKMSFGGQMHEGTASTMLGLRGIPSLSEDLQVIRDLQLLEYNKKGRLHFSQVSTAGAIDAIRKAKQKGLNVSCDVATYQCAFTDESIVPFDANFKVSPPFRAEADKSAIIEGLIDGTIDALVSAHTPLELEAKELEFDFAQPGIINCQTAFSIANQTLRPGVSLNDIINKLTISPRSLLKMPIPTIEVGSIANLTFFNPEKEWEFTIGTNASLSRNSPFLGKRLKGSVYGTYHNGMFTQNPAY